MSLKNHTHFQEYIVRTSLLPVSLYIEYCHKKSGCSEPAELIALKSFFDVTFFMFYESIVQL